MLNGVYLVLEIWNWYNNKMFVKNEVLKVFVYMLKCFVVWYNDYIYIVLVSNVFMVWYE